MQQSADLPGEIWIEIFLYLCLAKRCRISTVCKEWGSLGGLVDRSITRLSHCDTQRMQEETYDSGGLAVRPPSFSRLSHLVSFDGVIDEPIYLDDIKRHARSLCQLRIRGQGYRTKEVYMLDELTNLNTLILAKRCHINSQVLLGMPYLTSLDICGGSFLSDSVLERLSIQLRVLTLRDGCSVTDDSVSQLSNLSSLRLLNCRAVTAHGLSALTQLEHLSLEYWWFDSDNNLRFIEGSVFSGLTRLTSLVLKGDGVIRTEDISHLTSLRSLSLDGNQFLPNSVLCCFSLLTQLVLCDEFDKVSERALPLLTTLKALKLTDYTSNITSRSLCLMTQLTSLSVDGIRHEHTEWLSPLVNLRVLELGPCNYTLSHEPLLPISLEILKNHGDLELCNATSILTQISTRLFNLRILRLNERIVFPSNSLRHTEYKQAWASCTSLRALSTVYYDDGGTASLAQLLLPCVDIIPTKYDC